MGVDVIGWVVGRRLGEVVLSETERVHNVTHAEALLGGALADANGLRFAAILAFVGTVAVGRVSLAMRHQSLDANEIFQSMYAVLDTKASAEKLAARAAKLGAILGGYAEKKFVHEYLRRSAKVLCGPNFSGCAETEELLRDHYHSVMHKARRFFVSFRGRFSEPLGGCGSGERCGGA